MENNLKINIPDISNENKSDYIPSSLVTQLQPKSPTHIPHIPLNFLSPRNVLDSRTHSKYINGKTPRRPDGVWSSNRGSEKFHHLRSLRPLEVCPEISPGNEISSAREVLCSNKESEFISPSLKPSNRDEAIYLKRMMNKLIMNLNEKPKLEMNNNNINIEELFSNILNMLREEEKVYDICFDEIIRQVTIECVERGEIINSLRNEMCKTINYLLECLKFSFNKMGLCFKEVRNLENVIKDNECRINKDEKELCYLGEVLKKVRNERDKLHEDLLTERKQKEMNTNELVKLKHLSKYADIALKKLSAAITIESLIRGYLCRKEYEKILATKHAKKALKENEFIASKDGGLHILHERKETEYLNENKLDEDDDGYRYDIYDDDNNDDGKDGKNVIQMSYEKVQKQNRLESKSAFIIQKYWSLYKSKKGMKKRKEKKNDIFEFEKIGESDIKPLPSALIPECEEQTTFEKVELKLLNNNNNNNSISKFKPLNIKTNNNTGNMRGGRGRGRSDKNRIISNESSVEVGDSVCEYNENGKVIKGGDNYIKPDMIERSVSPIIFGKKSKTDKIIKCKYIGKDNKSNILSRPSHRSGSSNRRSRSNSRSNSRKSSIRKRRLSPSEDNYNYNNNNNESDENDDENEYNETDENIEYNPSKQYNKNKQHRHSHHNNKNNKDRDNSDNHHQQQLQDNNNKVKENNKMRNKSGYNYDSNIPEGEYMELNDTAIPNVLIKYDNNKNIDLMSPGEMLEVFEKKLKLLNELLRNSDNSSETKNEMFPQIKAVEKQIQRLKAPFYTDSDNKFSGWKEGIDEINKSIKPTNIKSSNPNNENNGSNTLDSFSSEISNNNNNNNNNNENLRKEMRKPKGKAFKWPKVLDNKLTSSYLSNKIDIYSEGLHIRGAMKMSKLLEFIRNTLDDLANSEFNKFMLNHRSEGTIGNGVIEVEESLFEDDKLFTLKKDLNITANEFRRVMSGNTFEIDEFSNYTRLGDVIYKSFHSKYGFKKLVDQHIVDLIYSLCTYREMNEEINLFSEMLEESISPRDLSRILHIRRLCRLMCDGYMFSNVDGEYNKEYLSYDRVNMTIRSLFGLSKSDEIIDHPIEPMLRRIKDIMSGISVFNRYIKNNEEIWITMSSMIKCILDEYHYQDKSKYQQKWIICRFIEVDSDKDGFINRDEFLLSLSGIEPEFDKREMNLLFGNITKSNDMTLNSYRNTMKSLLDEIGDNVKLPHLLSSNYAAESNFKTYSVSLALSKVD